MFAVFTDQTCTANINTHKFNVACCRKAVDLLFNILFEDARTEHVHTLHNNIECSRTIAKR